MAFKKLILVSLISLALLFTVLFIVFFVLPPNVVGVTTPYGNQSALVVKFDKPVKRQEITHLIYPEVYGEWKFQDPLIKNHLFKTLVFLPAIQFDADTNYAVSLENIVNHFGIGKSNDFSFGFKTQPEDVLGSADSQNEKDQITIIKIPFDWQDYNLSCEAASLKMGLSSKGVNVSEKDIMDKIGYDKTLRTGDIWGDPNVAFVGDINGEICSTGFGVYPEPVSRAANYWRPAEYFSGWNLQKLTKEIKFGNPVVVWGVLPTANLTDCSWHTENGRYVKAFKETHVRLAVGFIGKAENPSKIIIKDPLQGDLYWPTADFLTNWKVYGYSGVVIR